MNWLESEMEVVTEQRMELRWGSGSEQKMESQKVHWKGSVLDQTKEVDWVHW